MVGGGDHFYLKFWATGPRWSEIADFKPIFARNASAVTPSGRLRRIRETRMGFFMD